MFSSSNQFINSNLSKTPKEITEIANISNILSSVSFYTCVLFDYDNTLAEPTDSFEQIGSDQWFEALLQHAFKLLPDQKTTAKQLVLALSEAVQPHIKMQLIENKTKQVIKILQDIHIPVMLVTARGLESFEATKKQLKELELDFSKSWPSQSFKFDVGNPDNLAIYDDGQIYCNGNSKDLCIKKLFESIHYFPHHIIMVDDREKNLISVKNMMEMNGGHFSGLRYNKLDPKVNEFPITKFQHSVFKLWTMRSQLESTKQEKVSSILNQLHLNTMKNN
jgi:FMN phosphatase YigB (HAD superfamily)